MRLAAGASLGTYEIVAAIGAGGMGEVYRARDARLGRDVAIKVLPRSFAADPERAERFTREAKVLASLNHPHIAQIYGLEGDAIVMELVDGDTLASRLARGPLRLQDALAVAGQIASALDAAHEKGIVHRDVKPSNIAFTRDGVVKVLDFGLARHAPEDQASSWTASTTIGGTAAGVVLGTAPYMAPEQARGKPVDKRADIWAFGCVLYEMLTGRRAFGGDTTSDTIVAVLEREADWSALPPTVPDSVVTALQLCLQKDPKNRLRDIGDLTLNREAGRASTPRRHLRLLPWALTGLAATVAVLGLAAWKRGAPATTVGWPVEGVTFSIQPPAGQANGVVEPQVAVSGDGRFVMWVGATGSARTSIFLHTLSDGSTRQLSGTEGAAHPFWSPDSKAIGYQARGKLTTLDLATGATRAVATIPRVAAGAAWSPAGVIVFSTRYTLQQVQATGGEPHEVAALNPEYQENSLRFPRFLPDGRHFLYVARSGRSGRSAAYVGSIDGSFPRRLFPVSSHVEYVAPGYLLYGQDEQLVARPFDATSMTVGSELTTVLGRFGGAEQNMRAGFGVSEGVLAYLAQPFGVNAKLLWIDREGREADAGFPSGAYSTFRLAPDGRRVVVDNRVVSSIARDVWVLEPDVPPRRITFGGSDDWQPFWSADGAKVAWMSYRNGPGELFAKVVNGAAPETALFPPSDVKDDQRIPGEWAPDGRSVAYWTERTETRGDVWVRPLDGSPPLAIAATASNERAPRFAPDGRFIAYESDELGQDEVFVQPVPPTGGKWQISIDGGHDPVWRRDGRELYYIDSSGTLIAMPVSARGSTLSTGAPSRLFPVSSFGAGTSQYEPAPDGSRFLVRRVIEPPSQPITVLLGWSARLTKK